MDKKELRERYEKLDGIGKALLLEKLAFCKFADRYDFENYFRIEECYLMLMDIMNNYKEKFIFADTSLLREFEPDNTLMERISRIDILTDV